MGEMQRLSVEMPAFRWPAPQGPTSGAPMSRTSAAQRNVQADKDARRQAAIRKATDSITDTLLGLRKPTAEIAALGLAAANARGPLAKTIAMSAIVGKSLEMAAAVPKIVTELANLGADLRDFDTVNVEQQEHVRETLEKIADPLLAAFEIIDEALKTRSGDYYGLAKAIRETKEVIEEIVEDVVRDPGRLPGDAVRLKRAVETLVEESQKVAAPDKKSNEGGDPDGRHGPERSSLRPDDHAPTESNPGKNYNRFGPYPIAY
jgi:hypothetical protein